MAKQALIIDDSRTIRCLLVKLLSDLGFETEATTEDLYEGNSRSTLSQLSLAQFSSRRFDLVVCDLSIPDSAGEAKISEGMQLIHRMRELSPSVYIIALSAAIDDELLLEVLSAGGNAAICKADGRSLERISEIIKHSTVLSG